MIRYSIRQELDGILQSLPRFKPTKPWEELYSYQKRLSDNEGGWLDRLDALSDALNHEANIVRRSALNELLEFLQLNRKKTVRLTTLYILSYILSPYDIFFLASR